MSLISKIQSLISSANAVTGESRTDLTSAVQDLKDGYGGSTVEKGLVFSEYDSDGYPHKAEFVGSWTEIPINYYRQASTGSNFLKKMVKITIPEGVTTIMGYAFYSTNIIEEFYYPSTLTTIGQGGVASNSKCTLHDFSKAVVVPTLYDVGSLGHKSGCVIKVPQSLLSTWQTSTNWIDLQNVTWQGV